RPILQHCRDRSRFQLWREHPFRRDRETEIGENCLANALRSRDAYSPLQGDCRLGRALSESPGSATTALVINDSLVADEVGRRSGFAALCEVRWCCEDKPAALPNFACRQTRIRQRAHAQCDVDTGLDEIDVSIVEDDVDVERGVLLEKGCQVRHDEEARERDGRANTQSARRGGTGAWRGEVRLFGLFDRGFGMLVEVLP